MDWAGKDMKYFSSQKKTKGTWAGDGVGGKTVHEEVGISVGCEHIRPLRAES